MTKQFFFRNKKSLQQCLCLFRAMLEYSSSDSCRMSVICHRMCHWAEQKSWYMEVNWKRLETWKEKATWYPWPWGNTPVRPAPLCQLTFSVFMGNVSNGLQDIVVLSHALPDQSFDLNWVACPCANTTHTSKHYINSVLLQHHMELGNIPERSGGHPWRKGSTCLSEMSWQCLPTTTESL